jgi:type IV pilus assembly protein PilB
VAEYDLTTILPEILALIPKRVALECVALPLALTDNAGALVVAIAEGHSRDTVSDLAFATGRKILPQAFPLGDILDALKVHYGVSSIDLKQMHRTPQASREMEFSSIRDEEKKEQVSSDGSVVGLANRIITDAIRSKASDIHIEPYERLLRVRYRIDGILHEVMQPPIDKAKPLISRLKIMADLDIAERRRPQDGRIRVKEADKTIDIRVSSLPTDFGEKIVLRILDKGQLQLDLEKLGFEQEDLTKFRRTLTLPYGMLLVTGPTGSGKTTTLYGALNSINRPEINITTIEDPIEYNLEGINQTHVRSEIGVTFAHALRSILRQDPNVIMVGEIRDTETAEIAIRAALTGHLVFSTLHTNDAPSAITRLIEMGVEPFLVASSVKMILAQRLLRKLCDRCKVQAMPTAEEVRELGLDSHDMMLYYRSQGCPACNNYGYHGRTAVYEVLTLDVELASLISKSANATELRAAAKKSGVRSLRESALEKARRGETSLAEIIRETIG